MLDFQSWSTYLGRPRERNCHLLLLSFFAGSNGMIESELVVTTADMGTVSG